MINQSSRTEFVLSNDGKIIKRMISESEKELTADALASLASQTVTHWPNVFELKDVGIVSAAISKNTVTLAIPLKSIRIKTNYIMRDDVLVPAFDLPKEPVFDIHWQIPSDMRVFFVLELNNKNGVIAAHLPAIDQNKRCYRLPLGNIYETCQICMGEYKEAGYSSALEAFTSSYEQFDRAPWNNDLQTGEDILRIRRIFLFKPSGDGFMQLDSEAKWQPTFQVIAPPILNFIKI